MLQQKEMPHRIESSFAQLRPHLLVATDQLPKGRGAQSQSSVHTCRNWLRFVMQLAGFLQLNRVVSLPG